MCSITTPLSIVFVPQCSLVFSILDHLCLSLRSPLCLPYNSRSIVPLLYINRVVASLIRIFISSVLIGTITLEIVVAVHTVLSNKIKDANFVCFCLCVNQKKLIVTYKRLELLHKYWKP